MGEGALDPDTVRPEVTYPFSKAVGTGSYRAVYMRLPCWTHSPTLQAFRSALSFAPV